MPLLNEAGGTLNAGEVIKIGNASLLMNSGTILPGGMDNILTTTITGSLLQTTSGSIGLDVFGFGDGKFDQLFVTGNIVLGDTPAIPGVDFGGTVVFNLMDILTFVQFAESFTIFDFIIGGSPDAPSVFTDSTLFEDLLFMGMNSAGGTFDLLLMSDGGFAAVPIPATVWLFGSALGLLGWMRRRARN